MDDGNSRVHMITDYYVWLGLTTCNVANELTIQVFLIHKSDINLINFGSKNDAKCVDTYVVFRYIYYSLLVFGLPNLIRTNPYTTIKYYNCYGKHIFPTIFFLDSVLFSCCLYEIDYELVLVA